MVYAVASTKRHGSVSDISYKCIPPDSYANSQQAEYSCNVPCLAAGLTKTWRADGPDDGPERKWPVGVDADGPERKWPVGVAAGQLELTGRRGRRRWQFNFCLCAFIVLLTWLDFVMCAFDRAFQFGQKKFWFYSIFATKSIFSIRFGNLINLPLVHWYSSSKLGVIFIVYIA